MLGWLGPPAPMAAAGAVPGACLCLLRGGFLRLCRRMGSDLHPAQQELCLVSSSAVPALFRLCSITVCAWPVRSCLESSSRLAQPCLHTSPTLGRAQGCSLGGWCSLQSPAALSPHKIPLKPTHKRTKCRKVRNKSDLCQEPRARAMPSCSTEDRQPAWLPVLRNKAG